jgi:O-methyltransferase
VLGPLKAPVQAALLRAFERTSLMKFPPDGLPFHEIATYDLDVIRYTSIALAIGRVLREAIAGSFAEVGVFRGATSRVIHRLAPDRTLYLFDTFEGFPAQDLDRTDPRFRETSVPLLERTIGDLKNVVIRKGYFPETAAGLEGETFAFVMLDLDLYKPMLAGMEFFYPRLAPGGFLFAHDYNSPESDRAVSRALDGYLADKPDKLIDLPDRWGSVMLRKT